MMKNWMSSLTARLWLVSIVSLTASLALIATMVLGIFNYSPRQMWIEDENLETARRVIAGIHYDAQGQPVSVTLDEPRATLYKEASTALMYRIYDSDGNLILSSTEEKQDGRLTKWGPAGKVAESEGQREISINYKRYVLATLNFHHQGQRFTVQSVGSFDFGRAILDIKLDPVLEVVGWSIFIVTCIFALIFPLTIRHILRPLKQASDISASITPGNLSLRLAGKNVPLEIKPLIVAFNGVLERLEQGFYVQQNFLAAAAHELQTPLTLLRGQIELQDEIKNKEVLFQDIDFMARQVRQLLHLSEVSERHNYKFEDVDRVAVMLDVITYLSRKAKSKKVKVNLEVSKALPWIKADKSALFILIKNLLENAINVTPVHRAVMILVQHDFIQIADGGPGIKPEYRPFLFERFWRPADMTSEGAGLGLAICEEIIKAHNWSIAVEEGDVGSRFIIHFSR
ncbi:MULTISPECIES: sensor histidine kinase [unclassified Brenneria]|uniref:sensor histidine kinase n=1 Tax=unclassified Brenneria TaxID=2634434 RepID=UPI001556D8A6|nr:HAMP domain-containing sensor histidine kinase [Brenneria sp. hezel4-2-4]MEE3650607.1 HAMP domain-containing sensor histidine kinase [Brenneria sp. HEZEL_4_2_4]NPD00562.1 HAMP domain-containing histidine kinase [Brenneria sp. hezel4-2-4]